jgi:hypothetical protein
VLGPRRSLSRAVSKPQLWEHVSTRSDRNQQVQQ